jgi:hypothetical protein
MGAIALSSVLSRPSADAVDGFHAAALRSGGHDNGAPGLRPEYSPDYYAAFIIDPDEAMPCVALGCRNEREPPSRRDPRRRVG